ncbi:RmlC-like cupin domain superfamily [Sesbania bispinosa]|nr:RmlC-like cupin domain superfamily [Sesbania bispinosa]
MAKPFHPLSLSLCFLLLTSACLARLDWFNRCQLDRINALEPDHRVESEAGITETWNPRNPELQCVGVSIIKRTIDPKGLHLPSFSPAPQLIFIVEGKGALGISVPGCPETYEEPQGSSQSKQQRDSHQKIRYFNKGDVIAIPPGVPYWTYNFGNRPVVAISLLDTSNFINQLDATPRVFYLAGKPGLEHPETQEKQQPRHQSPGGRRHGQHQQEEESEEGGNVLSGFGTDFLSQSLDINEDIAKRLKSPDDERRQIVRVDEGLSVISPEWQEHSEEEEEEQGRREHGRRRHSEEEEEEEEEEEDEPRTHHRRWRRRRSSSERRRGPRREEEEEEEREEEEEEEERGSRGRGGCGRNGLEETICTTKIHENIAHPSRADLYNPRAGRISTVNSLTLPILSFVGLGAEYVVLYKNGIYAPHWNINANSLMYVIRGRGRVRVVNCQGEAVFNDELRRGQLLVVPQNFVVAQQAGDEGFEYVVFKTNDRASISHVKQVFRATPAEVLAQAFGLRQRQVTELKLNGNWGPLVHPQSHSSRSH